MSREDESNQYLCAFCGKEIAPAPVSKRALPVCEECLTTGEWRFDDMRAPIKQVEAKVAHRLGRPR